MKRLVFLLSGVTLVLTIALVSNGLMFRVAWAETITGTINATYGTGGGYSYLIGSQVWDLGPTSGGASISGTVSNLGFGTAGDSSAGSWFEIGFVAKNRADASITTYNWPPYMFNQSAFLVSYKTGAGHLLVMPADTDMGLSTSGGPGGGGANNGTYFDLGTGVTGFGFTLKIVPDGSGPGGNIVLAVTGQAGTKTWKYGIDDWELGWYWNYGYPYPSEEEFYGSFQQAYGIAQGYTNTSGGSVSADLTMDVVPEPATMLLLGSGLIGLAGFARKRFKK